MALYVTAVDENSPAERLGISVGCALLAIDGHPLNDALDYQFYTTPAQFSLALCEHEQHRTVQVEKGEYEPLGCNFKTYLGDEKHSCSNHCMFCFIDQLPPGMREPLYFKDDDERLSFLFGNYITLTNLSLDKDYEIRTILTDYQVNEVKGEIVHGEMHEMNTFETPNQVRVKEFNEVEKTAEGIKFTIPKCSVLHLEVR